MTDLRARLLQPLRQAGIPSMVTGELAAIPCGEPRLTTDVGIVLWLGPAHTAVSRCPLNGEAHG